MAKTHETKYYERLHGVKDSGSDNEDVKLVSVGITRTEKDIVGLKNYYDTPDDELVSSAKKINLLGRLLKSDREDMLDHELKWIDKICMDTRANEKIQFTATIGCLLRGCRLNCYSSEQKDILQLNKALQELPYDVYDELDVILDVTSRKIIIDDKPRALIIVEDAYKMKYLDEDGVYYLKRYEFDTRSREKLYRRILRYADSVNSYIAKKYAHFGMKIISKYMDYCLYEEEMMEKMANMD